MFLPSSSNVLSIASCISEALTMIFDKSILTGIETSMILESPSTESSTAESNFSCVLTSNSLLVLTASLLPSLPPETSPSPGSSSSPESSPGELLLSSSPSSPESDSSSPADSLLSESPSSESESSDSLGALEVISPSLLSSVSSLFSLDSEGALPSSSSGSFALQYS